MSAAGAAPPTETAASPVAPWSRWHRPARLVLFAYVLLISCPIRYWPLESGIDGGWLFALNFAAAQGPAAASRMVFTMGPLTYLLSPQHIGGNLARGLIFQAGLWLCLAVIYRDLFFRAAYPLRNLVMFSCCLALVTPMFWFSYVGAENLMLVGALVLLAVFHTRGGLGRYAAALALVGLLPVFKLTAALIGVTAIAGFLLHRVAARKGNPARELTLAVAVPAMVAAAVLAWIMPSVQAVLYYLRGIADVSGGYSVAMSVTGPRLDMVLAVAALAVLAAVVRVQGVSDPDTARSLAGLLAIPLFLSLKHGFVRQDLHVIAFFCFVAIALALASLTLRLDRKGALRVVPLVVLFMLLWLLIVVRSSGPAFIAHVSGVSAGRMLIGALRYEDLTRRLEASIDAFPRSEALEPEVVRIIGGAPVASLSENIPKLAAARVRIELCPVIQRYSAYTPYLDGLNAAWIRDRGPRFLVYDGQAIDGREPWAETPAMWLEVYRWYDTRYLGERDLLLERRTAPRFTRLERLSRAQTGFGQALRLPTAGGAVFWTMACGYSFEGKARKWLYRVPPVYMTVQAKDQASRTARVIPDVLVSPVMGTYLPEGLSQFAAVFSDGIQPGQVVTRLRLHGSGSRSYSPVCEVELLRPVR